MSGDHGHSAAGKNKKQLRIALGLTTAYMTAEVVGGILTGSLALLADAGHMMTDAAALGMALIAISFSARAATPQRSYGFYRLEILAALINAVVLLLISVYILYEAWQRLKHPPEVLGTPMLVVAAIGLVVNLISMRLLAGGSQQSLNVKGAYLEVMGDLLGSIGVIAASVIIMTTGWTLADPIIGAGIGLFIIPRTWTLLREAVHILMEGAPSRIDLTQLEQGMLGSAGVVAVHDMHVWTVTSGLDAISAHVTVQDLAEGDRILGDLQKILKERFDIEHTTIQLEGQQHSHEKLAI